MREGKFIDKNIKRWQSYAADTHNPDEQADRFIQIIDDLSYAKTFYPNSKTTQYINAMAAKQFQQIYQHQKQHFGRLLTFWQYELPLIFGKYHRIYLFTLGFFIMCVCMGIFSSMHDQSFIRSVLGDTYVDMTEDNIDKGDPFGVYKNSNELGMFIHIAANNIRVALLTFIVGLFAGVGTLYLLFSNGLMLGTFQYMFFAKGLGWQSVLVIWIHGTIEISAIVIAGTAGLMLGNAFLFPGTYSRLNSLKRTAKDAVKVIIGLIPFFILAAFFEGFVTRHTEMPLWLSCSILIVSFIIIIGYFVWYPIQLKKRNIQVIKGKVIFHS